MSEILESSGYSNGVFKKEPIVLLEPQLVTAADPLDADIKDECDDDNEDEEDANCNEDEVAINEYDLYNSASKVEACLFEEEIDQEEIFKVKEIKDPNDYFMVDSDDDDFAPPPPIHIASAPPPPPKPRIPSPVDFNAVIKKEKEPDLEVYIEATTVKVEVNSDSDNDFFGDGGDNRDDDVDYSLPQDIKEESESEDDDLPLSSIKKPQKPPVKKENKPIFTDSSDEEEDSKKPTRGNDDEKTAKKGRKKQVRIKKDKTAKLGDFSCKTCGRQYKRHIHCESHESECIAPRPKNKNELTCSTCSEVLKSVTALRHHMIIKHPESKIKCNEEGCDKEFHLQFDFDKHMDSHRKRICPICGKELANKKQLVRHLECHSETTFVCTICGKSYNTRYTLSRHMGTHLEVGKYKCNYCGKHFKNGKCMKLHLLAHSGLKPYKCGFCEKTFPDNTRCTDHMKRHPEWKEKKDLGQKITSVLLMEVPTLHELQEAALKNNVPVKPVASYAERKPQYIPCSICNLIFPSNYKLKLHLSEVHLRGRNVEGRLGEQQQQTLQSQHTQHDHEQPSSSSTISSTVISSMQHSPTTSSVVVLNQPQTHSQVHHQFQQQAFHTMGFLS
ncbi:hypothetical protein ACFFRR_008993 [Megaselia abdita]